MHGRIIKLAHESKCLAGNVLGDPAAREVFVYLPPGYDQETRDYPSVMLLPGFAATHHNIVGYGGPWKKNTVELFDDMVASGDSPAALLVMPDCMTRWGGSQFLDSEATGPYQSYLVDEVLPFVDARYRTVPDDVDRGEKRAWRDLWLALDDLLEDLEQDDR